MTILYWGYGLVSCIPLWAGQRSRHAADSIANAVIQHVSSNDYLRRSAPAMGKSVELFKRSSELFSGNITEDNEAFYIYNNVTNDGFVIVSADDRMPEVLGYSPTGIFPKTIPQPVLYWLEEYAEWAKNCINRESQALASPLLETIRQEGVPPLLGDLWWGQGYPYNQYCPKLNGTTCLVGCVATAMAQVMHLYRYPSRGKGLIDYQTNTYHLHVQKDLSASEFLWDSMKTNYRQSNWSEQEAHSVATLMSACGAAVYMDYGTGASGAFQKTLLNAFINNFGYDPDAAFLKSELVPLSEWHRILVNELNNGRAVNYAGNNSDGGHSFVIDGYKPSSNKNYYPLYHVNWGWNGQCDGYYVLSDMIPMQDGKPQAKTGYSQGHQMLVGIHPDNGISELGNYLYANKIRIYQATLSSGDSSIIHIEKIQNYGYRNFSGSLCVVAEDATGIETILGEQFVGPLQCMESAENLSIPITIPQQMPPGFYTVTIGYRTNGSNISLMSVSKLNIQVYEKDNSPYVLCAAEFQVDRNQETGAPLLRLYEMYNYTDETFEGSVNAVAISSTGDTTAIGSIIPVGKIPAKSVRPDPIVLQLDIAETLPDGDYQLCVCSSSTGGESTGSVMFYDCLTPNEQPCPYTINLLISGSQVTIGELTFYLDRTYIPITFSDKETNTQEYNLSGLPISSVGKKGIFIQKGKKRLKIN